jgi:hypothetical protein
MILRKKRVCFCDVLLRCSDSAETVSSQFPHCFNLSCSAFQTRQRLWRWRDRSSDFQFDLENDSTNGTRTVRDSIERQLSRRQPPSDTKTETQRTTAASSSPLDRARRNRSTRYLPDNGDAHPGSPLARLERSCRCRPGLRLDGVTSCATVHALWRNHSKHERQCPGILQRALQSASCLSRFHLISRRCHVCLPAIIGDRLMERDRRIVDLRSRKKISSVCLIKFAR